MKARQEWLRNYTNYVHIWKLGKSASDQELWKKQCVFRCWMRWCLSTQGSHKYILPVVIVKGRSVCIGYGVINRDWTQGPRWVGNGRVLWSLKERLRTFGLINTPITQSISAIPVCPYAPRRLPPAKLSGWGGEKGIMPPGHLHGPVQTEPVQSKTGSLLSSPVRLSCWTGLDWALSRTGIVLTGGINACMEARSEGRGISEEWSARGYGKAAHSASKTRPHASLHIPWEALYIFRRYTQWNGFRWGLGESRWSGGTSVHGSLTVFVEVFCFL